MQLHLVSRPILDRNENKITNNKIYLRMKIIYIILTFVFISFFISCEEGKLGNSIIEIPSEIENDPSASKTDIYIYENFIAPYNVNVKYKWDYTESDLSKNLVPPREEFVIPFLNVVSRAWMDPYTEIDKKSNGLFAFPHYVPKMLFLIGSSGYNKDGTVTQGTAEGGKKIVLYEVNKYDPKNISGLQRYFHVLHHEFGHIFHQTREFSPEFQNISAGLYTSTWYLTTDAAANQLGFITNYAMSEYHEDFVEMVAMMLTRSKAEWDALLRGFPQSGKAQVLAKESHVISYFKDKWNIDIFELQAIIHEKITEYMNDPDQGLRSNENSCLLPYFSYEENHTCQHHRQEAENSYIKNAQ
jgi:substrate import-associated zinc metallohydrolase lipoprotein